MHYFINIFIFASCIIATILAADLDLVDLWLNRQELNKYGDSVDTMYAGGSPLFNENTWEIVDRYLYLTTKFPSFPWLDNYEEEKEGPTPLDEGGAVLTLWGSFRIGSDLEMQEIVNLWKRVGPCSNACFMHIIVLRLVEDLVISVLLVWSIKSKVPKMKKRMHLK